ncbi:MAG: sulfurtransferase [Rubrivivax sp.]|jgi:UPF0176 protein|nr:sulfurtransferase [Rubrivivax sp.]
MDPILNVSAYRFVPVQDTAALQGSILERAQAAGLRGTVLIAEEGLNLALAGPAQGLRDFLRWLQADARFADLPIKESFSSQMPFRKLLVKVKREIIRMNRPAVRPAAGRAPAVPARTLVRWLAQGYCDEGRPVLMLDTRNAFEVDAGAFEGAVDWRLGKFSDFPLELEARLDELRNKTVVSYCTGGIRCEKAALVMRDAGLVHVHQLEGGILRYFEDTGSAPGWQGDCVVFDDRTALRPDLSPVRNLKPLPALHEAAP